MMIRKGQSVRRALAVSLLSTFLCCVMLAGSTFAWFSDSASGASVRITAGNLQIDLLKWDSDSDDYVSVAGEDASVFDPGFLWEPGATQIVYLAVENKGSLAAKFNVLLTVNDGGLASSLEYIVLSDKKYSDISEVGDWAALCDAAEADEVKQEFGYKRAFVLKEDGKLTDSENTYYFILAIHMKEGSENSYMNKWVNFDIAVNATQVPEEGDSFGSGYDDGLTLPEPHSYLIQRSDTDMGHIINGTDQWKAIVSRILPTGTENTAVKKVVFGRWNEQQSKLSATSFTEGTPIGVRWTAQGMQESDVRGFYNDVDRGLYILVDDPMGSIVISGSMGNSSAGYFTGWTSLEEADLSCLHTVELSPNDAENTDSPSYRVTGMGNLFNGCSALKKVTFGSGFVTSYVVDMRNMFNGCAELTEIDLTSFNTSMVTRMDNMFNGCAALESLDLTSFNTENVGNMDYMFTGCTKLASIELSPNSFSTAALTTMVSFFDGCAALEGIDLSGFDTSNVKSMMRMFYGCESLTSLDLSSFDTSKVTTMQAMFRGCTGLTSITFGSKFKADASDSFQGMFHTCSSLTLLDLSGFTPKESATYTGMFRNCGKLETIYATNRFDLSNKKPVDNDMFLGCTSINKSSTEDKVMKYDATKVGSNYAYIGVYIRETLLPGYFVEKPVE